MAYYVARLNRPYDLRVLIEAYIYSERSDFVHADFATYYKSLLEALQGLFGVRLARDGLSFDQRVLWGLFQNTVRSYLQITSPWAGYLEAGLIHERVRESGEHGRTVEKASAVIVEANKESAAAHRDMLVALFHAIFGECKRVVTSEDLRTAGFDDSKEPEISDYYDYM